MTTSFEYAPCVQRATYNDVNISVVWDLSKRLKYVSIIDPGKFNLIMCKKTTICTLGDGQHVECEPNPLIDSIARYLENSITDMNKNSLNVLVQNIEHSSVLCYDGADFVNDVHSIMRNMLISQFEETPHESMKILAQENIKARELPAQTSNKITLTIEKSTAIIFVASLMIAVFAVMQLA